MEVNFTMEQINPNGDFQQRPYVPISGDNQIPIFNTTQMSTYDMYSDRQRIEQFVESEMNRIKQNYFHGEEQFVEEMLLKNPIIIERRPTNSHQQQPTSDDEELDVVTTTTNKDASLLLRQQQQRAEACRRSRFNNKIKKAKTKYRYQFMQQKLVESTQLYDNMQTLIAQCETNLVCKGISREKIQHLRNMYGVDAARDNLLQQVNRKI